MDNTATYSISQDEQEDYLRIVINGCADLYNTMLIHNDVMRLLMGTDKTHVLVDITGLTGRLSIADSIKRAEAIPMEIRMKLERTAMLENRENRAFARNEEMAMTNRGIKVRIFFDQQDAMRWLLEHEGVGNN